MSGPIVTVCIVTCNQRDYIEHCIRSVLEQAVDATLGILVGDDASEDGTSEIVAKLAAAHGGKIEHLRRRTRLGAFANMRDLMTRAEGNFIARVDGDDYWLPGKLARQLAYLQTHPDCAAIYTNAITVDEHGQPIGLFNDVGDLRFDLAALLRRGNFLNNSSVLFPASGRQAWLSVDEPQIDYRVHLWHARHGFLAQVGEPLAAYRVSSAGSMVAHANEHVRKMYWEAITSVPRELVTDEDFAQGTTDFLRRVTLRALRTRHLGMLHEWAPRVFAASPYGMIRTTLLVARSIFRITFKELVGRFHKDTAGHRLKVLYRR